MATFTEHEDFRGKSIAFQLNKISCMCQADASNDTHNTTTHNNNSECTLCMFSVFKHVISCKPQQYNEVGTTLSPGEVSKTKVWGGSTTG